MDQIPFSVKIKCPQRSPKWWGIENKYIYFGAGDIYLPLCLILRHSVTDWMFGRLMVGRQSVGKPTVALLKGSPHPGLNRELQFQHLMAKPILTYRNDHQSKNHQNKQKSETRIQNWGKKCFSPVEISPWSMHTMRMAMANAELTTFFENIFRFFFFFFFFFTVRLNLLWRNANFFSALELPNNKNNDSIVSNDKHKLIRRCSLNCVFGSLLKINEGSRSNKKDEEKKKKLYSY